MLIGGGKLCEFTLSRSEDVLLQSKHDVEEISNYGAALNPVNLFWRGSKFILGRLYLTNRRLILLPYSQSEVERAHQLQSVSYKLLDTVGFGIPKPEIQFELDPILIRLDEIHWLNPFQRQFKIHPTLSVASSSGVKRFKFVPPDSPQKWAGAITEVTGCEVSDQRIA